MKEKVEPEENIEKLPKAFFRNRAVLILAILIGAWIIGMSIIIAGWLISKQIASSTGSPLASVNQLESSQQPATKPSKVNISIPATAPVLGSKDAKVTIVMFADFQCPFCNQWQKTVYPELKSKYIDKGLVKLAYMNYPFLGDESTKAAEAALCANDQGKFWEYHNLLFASQKDENSGAFSDDNLKKFAANLKLNTNTFNLCYNTNQHLVDVDSDQQTGNSFAVDSTPTLFIDGYRYEGIFKLSDYESIIDSELKK